MKRILRFSLNLGLVVLSIVLAFYAFAAADGIIGWLFPERGWPELTGLLFIPGAEDVYEMRDYTCSDHINSLGFRDREFGLEKTSKIRAVVIGDSVTYGNGVNLEDTWIKRAEASLRNQGIDIEMLNLGKPAAGPRDYANIAECAVPRLKPDMIIVCVSPAEDLQQLGNAMSFDPENYLKEHYPHLLSLAQHVKYRHSSKAAPPPKRTAAENQQWYVNTARELVDKMSSEQRAVFDKLEEPIKEAFFQGRMNPWMIGQTVESPDYFMHTLSLDDLRAPARKIQGCFQRIKKVADRNGAHLVILSVPDSFYVNREAHRSGLRLGFQLLPEMLETQAPEQAVADACARAGIKSYRSVTGEYRKNLDATGLWYEFDRHMTPAGNALYAERVTPIIAAEIGNIPRH